MNRYMICVHDRFSDDEISRCTYRPIKGHFYSVRQRRSENYPDDGRDEELYMLWEIFNANDCGVHGIYFTTDHFQTISEAEIGLIFNLDATTVAEINNRFIHQIDKMRRMGGGIASRLISYQDGIMELGVSTQRADLFNEDKGYATFKKIPPDWLWNPELKAATGYKVNLYLKKWNDTGEWDEELVTVLNGSFRSNNSTQQSKETYYE